MQLFSICKLKLAKSGWSGIEIGVAQELVDAGFPEEDIVLGFQRP